MTVFINILKKITSVFVNIIHFFIFLLPIIIYFIPKVSVKPYLKWILILTILIPLHWSFFGNRCILTIISKKLGDYDNIDNKTNANFSKKYLKWLYKPILNVFGLKWNSENLNKIIALHWIINIVIVWFYIFYVNPCYK